MRVFVTGATGVVGRRAVPLLIRAGHQVTAVARSPEKRDALARAGATAIALDLFAPQAVRAAVAGHDAVINLATHLPAGLRIFLPGAWRENDRIRREGSAILVDAALAGGVGRLIQESFAPVYPDRGDAWIDESVPIATVGYNRTVADAERSAERFSAAGRVGVVLRFALFYGTDSSYTRDLIGYVRRGFVPIPAAAGAYISSVSHDDAATAVVAALAARAGTYNVVDNEPMRRRDFFGALAGALGVPPPRLAPPWMRYLFGSLGEMFARSLRISNRKLGEECGWAPNYPTMRESWRALVEALGESRRHAA